MKNILFYNLNGIEGWSKLKYKTIDVARVSNIDYHKRIFKIADRDFNYTLIVSYDELATEFIPMPVVTFTGIGIGLSNCTVFTQTITKRYRTEEECLNTINEINNLKKSLELWSESVAINIREQCLKNE